MDDVLPKAFAQLSIFMPFVAQAIYDRIKTIKDPDFYNFALKVL